MVVLVSLYIVVVGIPEPRNVKKYRVVTITGKGDNPTYKDAYSN